jgi:WD40 repeat protein/transcriptional regulator with XRE-family HTH domain
METSSESFRSLLLRHRGRTGLIQRDLAARAGVSRGAVQDWEGGVSYPTAERLQALIRVLLEAGGLSPDREAAEARELWAAAEREAPRMHTPFDEDWFGGLLAAHAAVTPGPAIDAPPAVSAVEPGPGAVKHAQDWGEAPETAGFVGRAAEVALLRRWVLDEHCRLLAVLGMGGIGKTSLAARLAQEVALSFERVYWRSLRDAPAVSEWLAGAIGFLSDQQVVPPAAESERITVLLQLLRKRRCLVVLDNVETVLGSDVHPSGLGQDYAGFRRLVQVLAESSHESCVLLTSREAPAELGQLSGESGPVRFLALDGLSIDEGRALLSERELWGDEAAWASLVATYAGNGLALKVASATIHQVFGGDIAAFIAYVRETYGTAVRGIRRLMDGQVERRLSQLELGVLRWLAIEREPATFAELVVDLGPLVGRGAILEALESLRRRSLVERAETAGAAAFTPQSVVLEYVTDRLVEQAAEEIARGQAGVLATYPLIKAQSKDYVRRSQERLIAQPLLERLTAESAGSAGVEQRLVALLEGWRNRPNTEQGFGPGNVVNLLRLLRGDLRGMDLAHLAIRQAYLAGVEAQDASLANTLLSETVLGEAFGAVSSLAVSADGRCAAAGTVSGDLRVWRLVDRVPLLAVHGHSGGIWGVALSADGRLLASGSLDGTVKLWPTEGNEPLVTLQGHSGAVARVALSADGRLVASGGLDGTVRLWETERGQPRATLLGHTGAAYSVALSADGRLVASGGQDGTVRLWEVDGGKPVATLQGHSGAVVGLALSANGRLLVSGGLDGTMRLWEVEGGKALGTLERSTGAVWGVAISADGHTAASGSQDGAIRVWDVESGTPMAILDGHTGAVWGLGFDADRRTLTSGGLDGTVRLWDTVAGRLLATLQGHTGAVWGVAFGREGRLLASSHENGTVRLWDVERGEPVAILGSGTGGVYGVTFSADGTVASGNEDCTVRVWQVSFSGEAGAAAGSEAEHVRDRLRLSRARSVATLEGHTGAVWGVAFSADGRLLASGSLDGTVRLWAKDGSRPLAVLEGHTGSVWGVAFSADRRLLASGSLDGTVRLWAMWPGLPTLRGGQPVATLEAHSGGVWGVAFGTDGRTLASGGVDRTVRLWDANDGTPLAVLEGHSGGVIGVALSPDGRLLASASQDTTLRVWDPARGVLLALLEGHSAGVYGVAFSPDGRTIASGSLDGTVKLWDADTFSLRQTLRADRAYERVDITRLSGVTAAQKATLIALGAFEQAVDTDRAAQLVSPV